MHSKEAEWGEVLKTRMGNCRKNIAISILRKRICRGDEDEDGGERKEAGQPRDGGMQAGEGMKENRLGRMQI